MLPGLADPVLDSQRIFRSVLEAVAHPGRVVALAGPAETPEPLHRAAAAVCLALVDMETPLWLDAVARTAEVLDGLRFHCGCPIVEEPRSARFALIVDATSCGEPFTEWSSKCPGSAPRTSQMVRPEVI